MKEFSLVKDPTLIILLLVNANEDYYRALKPKTIDPLTGEAKITLAEFLEEARTYTQSKKQNTQRNRPSDYTYSSEVMYGYQTGSDNNNRLRRVNFIEP